MNTPLYNRLVEYSKSKLVFHMPGHKFGSAAGINELSIISLDNTEAMGMDNLYNAQGIIKEAMDLMADFYGAKETLFLTNGSTSGIIASILSICQEGEQLIVARNSHHSVWSALILGGITPIYISPQYKEADNIIEDINVETVEKALRDYPRAKGVLVVSPTYEGIVSDIKAIARVVHQYNKILIVDEAHGAHFILGQDFPISSIQQGADLVINSMHKTLPTLTQSGLLHICSNRIKYDNVVDNLRMIQTSSPSYMMMGLMDYVRSYIIDNKNIIKKEYVDELLLCREYLSGHLYVLKLIEPSIVEYDKSKIVISTLEASINGYELAELLNVRYNISVEAALETYIILMTTMADDRNTLQTLKVALKEIDKELKKCIKDIGNKDWMLTATTSGDSPRKIHYSNKVWISMKEAKGRSSANNIMLYPPGIPLICVGEVIKEQHIEMVSQFKDKLQGVKIIDNEILLYVV